MSVTSSQTRRAGAAISTSTVTTVGRRGGLAVKRLRIGIARVVKPRNLGCRTAHGRFKIGADGPGDGEQNDRGDALGDTQDFCQFTRLPRMIVVHAVPRPLARSAKQKLQAA